MNDAFGKQAEALVRETQHLRVKSDNDDKTIHLMREQYDALAGSVDGLRNKHEFEIHKLLVERDQAVRKHAAIQSLLLQTSNIVMQALRANKGDETPEELPNDHGAHISDDRLPIARLR